MRTRGWSTGACGALLAVAMVAGCTGGGAEGRAARAGASPSSVAIGPQGGSASAGGTSVTLRPGAGTGGTLRVVPAVADPERSAAAADVAGLVLGGRPVEVTLAGAALPADGATIRRELDEPVPAGQSRALAYYDEVGEGWVSVPTELSPDRRTLTATVGHFSFWDDVSYTLGDLFTGRSDPPACQGKVPAWVLDSVFLDDKDAPVRFCVGADPRRPDVLVVKATGNRAYGFTLRPGTRQEWVHSSLTGEAGPVDFLVAGLTGVIDPVEAFAKARTGSMLLAPGTGGDFGFTEAQIHKAGGRPVLVADVDLPYALAGLVYQVAQEAYSDGNRQLAAVFAVVNALQCAVRLTFDAGSLGPIVRCLVDQKDEIMRAVIDLSVKYDRKAQRWSEQQIARAAVAARRALLAVNAFGLGYQIGEAASDAALVKESRQALVTAKPVRPKVPTFPTAEAAIADWVRRNMQGRWRGACPDDLLHEDGGTAVCSQDVGWTMAFGGGYVYQLAEQGAYHPSAALLVGPLPDTGRGPYRVVKSALLSGDPGDDEPNPSWFDSAKTNGRRSGCYLQPAGAVRCGLPPRLDPACDDDETHAALCRFVVAATSGDLSKLSPDERTVARQAAGLPKKPWAITLCDMAGDITVLCEIAYKGGPSAGFSLQPRGGEYDPETGGYDVPEGGEVTTEVVSYEGVGPPGSFGP